MTDPVLARVRKLLAKAEDPCTRAEAEAFTAKATELIAKYGVDRAMLAAQRPSNRPGRGPDRAARLAGGGLDQGYAAGRTADLGGVGGRTS
jgi:hypothetical protein